MTPSDFPIARLDQKGLDRLAALGGEIEDVYPLSPAQLGILFHLVHTPESRLYYQQFVCTLQGDLDTAAFRQAWQESVARYSVLRSSFVWHGLRSRCRWSTATFNWSLKNLTGASFHRRIG